jgi:acyl-coenzyme A synthetase/AMP-(fatty) acid ligase
MEGWQPPLMVLVKLKKIDGVDDGIFFIPKEDTNKRVRLAALVVSSTLTRNQIIQLLSQIIDPVFLPRPLKVVASLPYNKLGKLPFNNLIKMIDGASLDI